MMVGSATLDHTRTYRYELTRPIESVISRGQVGTVTFIMLNPSTANETQDDPTIRKCIGYAERWSCAELIVTNLFAYRTPSPKDLKLAVRRGVDIVGGAINFDWILSSGRRAKWVICAWGNDGELCNQGLATKKALLENGVVLHCLKLTKKGQPYHPLYLKWDVQPVEWKECP